jgi:hypothetical protein
MKAPIISMTIDGSLNSHRPRHRACGKQHLGERMNEAGKGDRQATAYRERWAA